MTKTIDITDRDRQMLELLSQGDSNRAIAESMGYREGTMRVYLHGLYRKLGVGNKTAAVIWYFDYLKSLGRDAGSAPEPGEAFAAEESFGDLAVRQSPLAALGAFSMFIGTYGRMWSVGNRLKGVAVDAKMARRGRQSRQLWESLLAGDFGYAKRLYDDDQVARLIVDSPPDCVLLACLLRLGGYSRAADRVMAQLARRRKSNAGVSAKEFALVTALREAVDARSEAGVASVYRMASESSAKPFPRHAALASLFWLYRGQHDRERACQAANALFAEAEAIRGQLHAMGEKPLYRDGSVPGPKAPLKAAGTRTTARGARAALAEA